MRFGVLGPLEVTVEGRPVSIRSARQRTLLACLVLHAGELVTAEELAEAIWGDELPDDPRGTIHTYVTRLRKLLDGRELIQHRPKGYALAVTREKTDLGLFERLVEQARQAAEAEDRKREAMLLGKALRLWRGEPLADVDSEVLYRGAAARLAEQHLEVVQRRIEAELALGRHAELVGELQVLTERYPMQERLWSQLLRALYRSGRQADALEAYQHVRGLLAEQLGVDPGPELRALQHAILTHQASLTGPAGLAQGRAWVAPSQLPLAVGDLVGRGSLVEQAIGLLMRKGQVAVVALSGPPGVGKSALAIHAAHRLAEQFPDGQLYVNLHGATEGLAPLRPAEVLGRFLRALGMDPGAIPADLEEAAGLFRSHVAGRRLLVVLDDAADAAQVRPLLPATAGCGVLVTSRRVLASLEGAHQVHLDVLTPDEAVELLGRLVGRERVAAEPEAAAEVARLCGYLPLAVRIAGARLVVRPAWPVAVMAERLADAQRRLDELALGDLGVRASFAVSYEQLHASGDPTDRAAAAAFGLLGVWDGPQVGIAVVARLLDGSEDDAERLLERLVDAHLLESPSPGRYRLHDLLRLYARELAHDQQPEPVRAAALTRALSFYTATTWQTMALLRPGDARMASMDDRWAKDRLELADDQVALAWLEAERPNLLVAIQQAATTPGVPGEIAIQLTQALVGFYDVRNHWDDWAQANHIALGVARQLGDPAAQAQANNDLGLVYWLQGRYEDALTCLHESLAVRRELGDRSGEGASLGNLGMVYRWQGRYEEALTCLHESLAICRELADRSGASASLGHIGEIYGQQGRYAEALACLRESFTTFRELGARKDEGWSLSALGSLYQRQGRSTEALGCLQESLALFRRLGDRDGQAVVLHQLGVLYQRQGQHTKALACHQESLAIRRDLGEVHGQTESLRELGITLRALHRTDEARAHWLQALNLLEQLQTADAEQIRNLLSEEASGADPA